MTKEDAWDIVAGLVENIDADDMAQLIERLDDMLHDQGKEQKQ